MNKKLIEELLKTKTEDDFLSVLISQDEEYVLRKDLWDEEVITHFLKLFNIPKSEFDKQFPDVPPIDDFD